MDHPYEFDLICIGCGPAGRWAAIQAAELGKRVAIVEKQRTLERLGVNGGTMPSKTLREAVRSWKLANRARSFTSDDPYQHPDFGVLREHVQDVCEDEGENLLDQFQHHGVELISGKARFVDAHTIAIESVAGVREITTDYVMLAVGTYSVEPPGIFCDGEVFIDVDILEGVTDIPRSLIVLGCGLIGFEYGTMLAALGTDVTLVDSSDAPLAFLDRSVFEEVVKELGRQRLKVRFGTPAVTGAVEVGDHGRHAVVKLADGTRLVADAAFLATGRNGNTESLGLDSIGVATSARGHVQVDANYRTSVRNVYAAGDVIGGTPRASLAAEEGRIAACRMFGADAQPLGDCEVIGVYSVPEIAMVGVTEQQLAASGIPYVAGIARYREIARGAMLGDEFGFFKMLFDRRDRRLVGAHCAGTHATELIHVAQAVIALSGTLDFFLTNVFNYPTLAECYKVAALHAANQLATA